MARAGTYRDRVEWLQKTKGVPDTFGDRKPTFTYPSQGFLWAVVEDVAGGRESRLEAKRQVSTANVRLRNYPAVVAGDRLSAVLGTMTVLSVVGGDNEVTCEVEW
jgi:hypothetical protein